MSSIIVEAVKRPFKWLVSILLLPFKILIGLVGKVISFAISLVVFFLILGAVLVFFNVVSPPEQLPIVIDMLY